MLKTLKTLIRIQDNELQGFRVKLNKAEEQEENLIKRLHEFDDAIAHEQEMTTQDYLMSKSYSAYLEYALDQRKKFAMLIRDAQAITKIARDNLQKSYAEMKRLENIEKIKKEEARKELEMKEQKAIDDLIQATYKPNKENIL